MSLTLPEPRFFFFNPPADLAPYVRIMYLIETPYLGVKQFIPAWNKPLMVLQYSEPVFSTINGSPQVVPDISFSGMVSRKYGFFTPATQIRLMMVEFTPVGIYSLFREKADAFTDLSVDASSVIPARKQQTIVEALQETDDVYRKANLVYDFLRTFVPKKIPGPVQNVQNALEVLAEKGYSGNIRSVADELALSERTLRRCFLEITGLPPKKFARIERFNHLFNRLMEGNTAYWQYMTRGDYFDQPHMIRDFQSFTGFSPNRLPSQNFFLYHILTR